MATLLGHVSPCGVENRKWVSPTEWRTGSKSPWFSQVEISRSFAYSPDTYLDSKVRLNLLIPTFPFFSSIPESWTNEAEPSEQANNGHGLWEEILQQTTELIAEYLLVSGTMLVTSVPSHLTFHRNPLRRVPICSLFLQRRQLRLRERKALAQEHTALRSKARIWV